MDTKPRMFYFGPWDRAGHYFFDESGYSVDERNIDLFPFGHGRSLIPVDGILQPHTCGRSPRDCHKGTCAPQGQSLIHHIQGWTALSFWDSSVDTRSGCNSSYFAEGTFTFDEMVAMAKERFAYRWNKMPFKVFLSDKVTQP